MTDRSDPSSGGEGSRHWGKMTGLLGMGRCKLVSSSVRLQTYLFQEHNKSFICVLSSKPDSDPIVPVPCGKENKETYWVALSSMEVMFCGFGKAALASL